MKLPPPLPEQTLNHPEPQTNATTQLSWSELNARAMQPDEEFVRSYVEAGRKYESQDHSFIQAPLFAFACAVVLVGGYYLCLWIRKRWRISEQRKKIDYMPDRLKEAEKEKLLKMYEEPLIR